MNRPSSTATPEEGNEPLPFDWGALVPFVIHPMRVAIIEALCWIGEPLSATDFQKLFAEESYNTSYISYHVAELAKAGVLVQVATRQVRGATKKSYFFPSSG
jgi:Helix-turn-helix domain